MRVIVDDRIPFIRGQVERVADEVEYVRGADIGRETVRGADALIVRTRTHVDGALLEGSRVGLVVTATIGYDHIDTAWLEAHGVEWTNCPGCNAESVAQYVHNALTALGLLDTAPERALTVGVVGVGHVGGRVAADLERSGCRVLWCDPPREERGDVAAGAEGWHSLAELARTCDVLTLHTPLTAGGRHATRHLVSDGFLHALCRRPLLINAARGGVADDAALVRALQDGRLGAAVVDTWEGEPDIDRRLLRLAAIGTPHIAGYSADGKATATRMALEALARFARRSLTFDITPPQLPDHFAYGACPPPPATTAAGRERLRLYDPRADSGRLKDRPEDFELLRGSYPLRRETARDGGQ